MLSSCRLCSWFSRIHTPTERSLVHKSSQVRNGPLFSHVGAPGSRVAQRISKNASPFHQQCIGSSCYEADVCKVRLYIGRSPGMVTLVAKHCFGVALISESRSLGSFHIWVLLILYFSNLAESIWESVRRFNISRKGKNELFCLVFVCSFKV